MEILIEGFAIVVVSMAVYGLITHVRDDRNKRKPLQSVNEQTKRHLKTCKKHEH